MPPAPSKPWAAGEGVSGSGRGCVRPHNKPHTDRFITVPGLWVENLGWAQLDGSSAPRGVDKRLRGALSWGMGWSGGSQTALLTYLVPRQGRLEGWAQPGLSLGFPPVASPG